MTTTAPHRQRKFLLSLLALAPVAATSPASPTAVADPDHVACVAVVETADRLVTTHLVIAETA